MAGKRRSGKKVSKNMVKFITKSGEHVSFSKKIKRTKPVKSHLKLWIKAAQENGYMKKGSFKKLPKKGSDAYKRIKKSYSKLK